MYTSYFGIISKETTLFRYLLLIVLVLTPILTTRAGAQTSGYTEAPQLAQLVESGQLPPIEERLPETPLVVEPHERIGQYGGDWRWGMIGSETAQFARTMSYEGLMRWNPEWTEVIPNVVESYEINEDATEYTFTLRQGMRWSDGYPFTADDILFWYEDIVMNEELYPGGPPAWLGLGGEPFVVEKSDDYTVVFRFTSPQGLFLQRLAHPNANEITESPRHYLEQFHEKYNPEDINRMITEAGASDWASFWTGRASFGLPRWQDPDRPSLHAWNLTSPLGEGTRVIAERNPYYWKVDPEGNQLPYLHRRVFEIFGDAEVLVLRALGGEIDMQDRHIATLQNKSLFTDNMERGGYHFYETVPSDMNSMVIMLNLNHKDSIKREIFQNKDFRIGLSHAINRQEIIDLVYVGQGEPWQVGPRPESPYYHEQLAKQYTEYDVELANEYLDQAGYIERDAQGFRLRPDGTRISFTVETTGAFRPEWVDNLELIQNYWQDVGLEVQIRVQERSLLITREEANEVDVMVWLGENGGGPDVILNPEYYFPFNPVPGHGSAYIAWATWYAGGGPVPAEEPPTDVKRQMELYDQLKATANPEQHIELMHEILEISAEQFYLIGINLPAAGYGIVKNNFHNVPESMPHAWIYPAPAPTNPEQYFLDSGN